MHRTNELLDAFNAKPNKTNARALVAHMRRCLRAQMALSEDQEGTLRNAIRMVSE